MYRSGRAGRNAWQLLAKGPNRQLQRPASTEAAAAVSTTRPGGESVITTTTTFTKTTVMTRKRPPRNSPDTAALQGGSSDAINTTSSVQGAGAGKEATPEESNETQQVIFSGIQPTGIPHLGNYLGALREWKRLQDTAPLSTKLLFCIADLHAATIPRPASEMYDNRVSMMAVLRAMGLNQKRSTVFFQSAVPAHAELQWILSCTASTGYLGRMTQWKSKLNLDNKTYIDNPKARKVLKHGLFSYPILQAADILLYQATHVPVGEDQQQHLEFARECVTNFNHAYNTDILVSPATIVSPSRRVMSLTNPLKKMSKSDPAAKSRILVTDSPEEIEKKIKGAVTDSIDCVSYDPEARPGVSNLISILAGFDPQNRHPGQLAEKMQGYKVQDLKQVVTQVLCDELAGIREGYQKFLPQAAELEAFARTGADKARASASKTMDAVYQAVGFGPIR